MKKIIVLLVLIVSMFLFVGCVPPSETPDPTPETNEPTFMGVTMALGAEKEYIETDVLLSSYLPQTYVTLSSPIRSVKLSTSSNNSFEGTIINGVYISTKDSAEYLVLDIEQPENLSDRYTFNNFVIGSNEWETDKIFTLGSQNNKFYTSDDLTKVYIPVAVSAEVSSTQEFIVRSFKYLDGVSYKDIRFDTEVVDTINILVAGNPIDFDPNDMGINGIDGSYNKESRTITINMKNNDSLPISEIYINNQLAYTKETLSSMEYQETLNITIPEDISVNTYNWVKVKINYSVIETEDEALLPYVSISSAFILTDTNLLTYDYNGEMKSLMPEEYLILTAEDLSIIGSDYYERLQFRFVNDIDLRGIDFSPMNASIVALQTFEPNLYAVIYVDENTVFIDTQNINVEDNHFYVFQVAFSNTVYVNIDYVSNYNLDDISYFNTVVPGFTTFIQEIS